ncbi:hypothetical protein KFE25_006936 [Diacronema lutheri]|uniref:Protein kinase domain-containing protein n=1 Tax=Diacronema lutheri TaxID=2081491 RepID=A0A8J5XWX4_DIALT|nr:hypothetical protein KFE25_006936 [Diacronema lutheri]
MHAGDLSDQPTEPEVGAEPPELAFVARHQRLRALQELLLRLDSSSIHSPSAQKLRLLALADGHIDYARLTFHRRIGEGAFALVDLYSMLDPPGSSERSIATLSAEPAADLAASRSADDAAGSPQQPAERSRASTEPLPSTSSTRAPRLGLPRIGIARRRSSARRSSTETAELLTTLNYMALKSARKYEVLELSDLAPGERHLVRLPDSEAINIYAEGVLLRQLAHENIVKVLGFTTFPDPKTGEDTFAIVQEFMRGGTLLGKITAGGYGTVTALTWLVDISRGLRYLHHELEIAIAHRDLKPENILITADNRAKIADFGLFRFMVSAQMRPETADQPAVLPNGLKPLRAAITTGRTGSERYMAPENWHRQAYSSKVDVFSFAVLAWEVFASKRAYQPLFLTAEQIAQGVATKGLRPTLPTGWPVALKELMGTMWSDNPADRPDFTRITQHLELMLEEQSVAPWQKKATRLSLVSAASSNPPYASPGVAITVQRADPASCCVIS